MFAITQAEYYLTLLKYIAITTGGITAAFAFFGLVYLIVFFGRYWK